MLKLKRRPQRNARNRDVLRPGLEGHLAVIPPWRSNKRKQLRARRLICLVCHRHPHRIRVHRLLQCRFHRRSFTQGGIALGRHPLRQHDIWCHAIKASYRTGKLHEVVDDKRQDNHHRRHNRHLDRRLRALLPQYARHHLSPPAARCTPPPDSPRPA